MSIVNSYGFDGVDIDWETTWNATEVTNLLSGLRSALGTKLLTADAAGIVGNNTCNTGGVYTVADLANLDRLIVDVYDTNGSWNPETWFNEPLHSVAGTSSVDSQIAAAKNCGYTMSKVGIGIPFYGYFQSPSKGPYQPFGASPTLNQLSYSQMLATYGFSGATFDTTAHEPWRALSSTSWIQWDDAQAVTDKVNYVQSNGLGGWLIWWLGGDYTSGASPDQPLLDAVGKAFHSSSRLLPPTNLQIISVN
jgi:chitinase